MAEEKKEVVAEKAAPKKKAVKAEKPAAKTPAKAEAKVEEKKVVFAKPTKHDYEIVYDPYITEKSMALLQNANKVTVKVSSSASKTAIKESFQRLYQAKVVDVKIVNQRAKAKSRGGRYQGVVSGFKKAVVTLASGSAVDLFKE
ncbi:MAG: 50S ribosomal protein L23 [Bacilli bacterium]|jgi:large subunit ribosomal protein L23|nr:50S ribosomal protein L23 [Bacilli bacterium]MCH4228139.1 50S ribosomal protein L23 [Bacilli bacterium]MCH4278151.1 50S ribosomal protein L23 [Bacilli bacterium]MCI2054555.1 50S ribosomal protein L23 [Bacilli bacterium]